MAGIGQEFVSIEVPESRVSVADAVSTYLFNSQILTRADGGMSIIITGGISPEQSSLGLFEWHDSNGYANWWHQGVWSAWKYAKWRWSCMFTLTCGGEWGGTLLRSIQTCLMNDALFKTLNQWVDQYYRDELTGRFGWSGFIDWGVAPLDELTRILGLGSVYHFQR